MATPRSNPKRSNRALLLQSLNDRIVRCDRCPRLRTHCAAIAKLKRRAYQGDIYWGRPVPGFGDPDARLLIVGLAPGAHGANRTGRMFTGDSSGDFLYGALHRLGLASQPASTHSNDGLRLKDTYITAVARCAPPDNRPLPDEIRHCREYLTRELEILDKVNRILALGRIAFEGLVAALVQSGRIRHRAGLVFHHGAVYPLDEKLTLFASYHPSRQNTQTGRLTRPMFDEVLKKFRG